jgi:drug/metabolite transporter (DMT)-like permease
MNKRPYLPILMTAGAALLWASSFSVVKIGLRYIDPYSFVFLRFAVATSILFVIVVLTGHLHEFLNCLTDRYSLLLGLVLSASFGLQFIGQTETTAAKAALIINSSVVLVAPLSLITVREQMGLRKMLALAVGLCGVYLVTRSRSPDPGEIETVKGNLLVAGSALSYAVYIVLTKLAVSRRDFHEIPLIAGVFLWSLPVFLSAGITHLAAGFEMQANALLAICYLAVFCSVLPFVIWTAAIKHIGALTSAIVLLTELVFGVLIAHLFLGEMLSSDILIGCGLICAAIVIIGGKV